MAIKRFFLNYKSGRAMSQAVIRRPLAAETRVRSRVLHVGFVVDKVALGQVFSEYFGFLLSIPFHRCSIKMEKQKKTHHLPDRVAQ
jgi:hypothetical protein